MKILVGGKEYEAKLSIAAVKKIEKDYDTKILKLFSSFKEDSDNMIDVAVDVIYAAIGGEKQFKRETFEEELLMDEAINGFSAIMTSINVEKKTAT